MTHAVSTRDGTAVITLRGRVMGGPDGATLYETLRSLSEDGCTRAVLDLSAVDEMNPLGLGVLVGALALMRNQGGELAFAAVPKHVRSLLMIARLGPAVPCHDTVDDALAALAGD
mgnify:CR=1 FL=1